MTDIPALVRLLHDGHVEFILIGGVAANAWGAPRVTIDLDVVYRRSADNLSRLVSVLAPFHHNDEAAARCLPHRDERLCALLDQSGSDVRSRRAARRRIYPGRA